MHGLGRQLPLLSDLTTTTIYLIYRCAANGRASSAGKLLQLALPISISAEPRIQLDNRLHDGSHQYWGVNWVSPPLHSSQRILVYVSTNRRPCCHRENVDVGQGDVSATNLLFTIYVKGLHLATKDALKNSTPGTGAQFSQYRSQRNDSTRALFDGRHIHIHSSGCDDAPCTSH